MWNIFSVIKDDFREEPIDETKSVGSTVVLRCRPPKGEPDPQVSWTYNSGPVNLLDKRVSIQGEGNLVIERLKKEDSGEYVCKAQNLAGEKKSSPVQLKVLGLLLYFTCLFVPQNVASLSMFNLSQKKRKNPIGMDSRTGDIS